MVKIGKQGMDSGMAQKRPEIESYRPTRASQERIESRLACQAYANSDVACVRICDVRTHTRMRPRYVRAHPYTRRAYFRDKIAPCLALQSVEESNGSSHHRVCCYRGPAYKAVVRGHLT